MYVERKVIVKIPNGFYCEGCSALYPHFSDKGCQPYCNVTGEYLKKGAKNKCIKTEDCFKAIRNHLVEGKI